MPRRRVRGIRTTLQHPRLQAKVPNFSTERKKVSRKSDENLGTWGESMNIRRAAVSPKNEEAIRNIRYIERSRGKADTVALHVKENGGKNAPVATEYSSRYEVFPHHEGNLAIFTLLFFPLPHFPTRLGTSRLNMPISRDLSCACAPRVCTCLLPAFSPYRSFIRRSFLFLFFP